jgi:nucleoside-diphosphate-sugar epimerase
MARLADVAGRIVPGLPGSEDLERLTESFVVDDSQFRTMFSFQPRVTVEAGLAATAAWWRARPRQ